MGAESRIDVIKGTSLQAAFHKAQDENRYESGSSYTGTMAEARGVRIVSKPLPLFDAEQLGQRLLGDEARGPQKWGEAHAIPVLPMGKQRVIELEVDVTGAGWGEIDTRIAEAAKPRIKPGESIETVRYNGANRHYGDRSERTGTKQVKIVKTAGKGKLVKRYLVATKYGNRGQHTVLGGFDALAEAQEYAAKEAERQHGTDPIVIWPYQKREDGPLFTYQKVVVKETVWAKVTVGVASGTPESWVIAGVYSC
jgi:hypothetical protein